MFDTPFSVKEVKKESFYPTVVDGTECPTTDLVHLIAGRQVLPEIEQCQ